MLESGEICCIFAGVIKGKYGSKHQDMIHIEEYIAGFSKFPFGGKMPWEITSALEEILAELMKSLGDGFVVNDGVAIHQTAVIGHNMTIKSPAVISAGCFVGANSYLRNGVFLAAGAKVGISCEVKTTMLMEESAVAHFNFVGDSIIGRNVNIEAGAILANHFNERSDKTIYVRHGAERISTGVHKFGSLVGDGCRIGANAVLSPGTLLKPSAVVRRLELVEQDLVEGISDGQSFF